MGNRSTQNGATCVFSTQWCGTKCGKTTSKLAFSQKLQTVVTVAPPLFFGVEREWLQEYSKGLLIRKQESKRIHIHRELT